LGVAGEIETRPIDGQKAAVEIAGADQVAGVLDEFAVTQLAVAERGLRVTTLGDVSQQHDITGEARSMRPNRCDEHVVDSSALGSRQGEVLSDLTVDARWPVRQCALDEFAGGAGTVTSEHRFGGAVQIGDLAGAVQNNEAVTNHLDARISQCRNRFEYAVAEHSD